MRTSPLEVADVFRRYGAETLLRFRLGPQQRRALHALSACRTTALGGHVEACDHCGHRRISYNSCRDRHCPKCQGSACAKWLSERAADLLPVPYFHVVFTLPDTVAALALRFPRVVYGALFEAAAKTLLVVAADPRRLGARIGCIGVLHTWGQNLTHHPHVHFIVTGGGVSPDGQRWIASRKRFFLPVRVLSRVFRGKFIALLRAARSKGRLADEGLTRPENLDAGFEAWLTEAVRQEWVVYAKPPFGGPAKVLKYLARYSHRVAISNDRLVALKDDAVSFRWKDYAHGNAIRVMTIEAVEFIRRFLQHVLPKGFVKIRHYGFLANRDRRAKLALARQILSKSPTSTVPSTVVITPFACVPTLGDHCPICRRGTMTLVETLNPLPPSMRLRVFTLSPTSWDSS